MGAILPFLGVIAGVITTLTGQGGGLVLLIALSALVGPHRALALSTVALFIGNAHRLIAYRRRVVWSVALPLMISSGVGSFFGGRLAARAPEWFLKGAIVTMTVLGLWRRGRGKNARPMSKLELWGGGAVVGVLTGTAGGAGFMLGPLTMSAGLSGEPYMATQAAAAVMINLGRMVAYASAGMYARSDARDAIILTLGVLVGNLIATWLRPILSAKRVSQGEVVVLLLCAIVTVVR